MYGRVQDDALDIGDGGEAKRSARPRTAGRRPPKIKEGAKEVTGKDAVPTTKKSEGILIDGQAEEVGIVSLLIFFSRADGICRVCLFRMMKMVCPTTLAWLTSSSLTLRVMVEMLRCRVN